MKELLLWYGELNWLIKCLIGCFVALHIAGIAYLMFLHYRDNKKNFAEFSKTKLK